MRTQHDADTAGCPPGKQRERYSFGKGLYLDVLATGRKTWTLRSKTGGKDTNRRIGNAADLTLDEARQLATGNSIDVVRQKRVWLERDLAEARNQITYLEFELEQMHLELDAARVTHERQYKETLDRNSAQLAQLVTAIRQAGISTPDITATAPVFAEYASRCFDTKRPGWRTSTANNWKRALDKHIMPTFGNQPIDTIDTRMAANLLNQLTNGVQGVAKGVLRDIFNHAKAEGAITDSPVGEQLKALLQRDQTETKHHKALSFADAPAFYQANIDPALRLVILTALRSNEVLKSQWSDLNADAQTLTIPKERMKAKSNHTVPLSRQALAIIDNAHTEGRNHLFSLQTKDAPMHSRTMQKAARDAGVTVHGFRTTFEQWCQHNSIPWEWSHYALSHTVGNQTQRAYERDTMLEQRREIMQRWADYLEGC